ncbi:MAG: HD domain-containing protein [Candidatus Gastranaerophilales bacterium]|nr:HD domain-containing protein [Candidatus Gastranaerophilales bacterium]
MTLNVDNNLMSKGVAFGAITSTNPNASQGLKTKPMEADSFRRSSVITIPTNKFQSFYNKILEKVAPNVLLNSYLNDKNIQLLLLRNPNVKTVLNAHNMPLVVNTENVKGIKKVHIDSTRDFASGIAKELRLSSQEQEIIKNGAIFHDYGKILIPAALLNKNGRLTVDEKKIVDMHSRLGYEMLKSTGMSDDVLSIVRDHHKPLYKNPDVNTQVVSVADIYSALTTKRPYKEPLSPEKSFQILDGYVDKGQVDAELVKALKSHVNQSERV